MYQARNQKHCPYGTYSVRDVRKSESTAGNRDEKEWGEFCTGQDRCLITNIKTSTGGTKETATDYLSRVRKISRVQGQENKQPCEGPQTGEYIIFEKQQDLYSCSRVNKNNSWRWWQLTGSKSPVANYKLKSNMTSLYVKQSLWLWRWKAEEISAIIQVRKHHEK